MNGGEGHGRAHVDSFSVLTANRCARMKFWNLDSRIFFPHFLFFIRKADPGKEQCRRVETGGAESNKCGDPNQ